MSLMSSRGLVPVETSRNQQRDRRLGIGGFLVKLIYTGSWMESSTCHPSLTVPEISILSRKIKVLQSPSDNFSEIPEIAGSEAVDTYSSSLPGVHNLDAISRRLFQVYSPT